MSSPSPLLDADVAIAGAGWAGLASAAVLSTQGYKVLLLEAAAQAGGRARSIETPLGHLDNGQHIFIGAYTELLELIRLLNIPESRLFIRQNLELNVYSKSDKQLHIKAASLPSPLHLLVGLLTARGMSFTEKWSIIRCWLSLLLTDFKVDADEPVASFLIKKKQSPRLIKLFWEPLCIAALNTSIDTASTQIYLNVLQRTFKGKRSNSDFLFARTSLNELLPLPLTDYIRKQGAEIKHNERLRQIHINSKTSTRIETSRNTYTVRHLLLATPFHQTHKLLSATDSFANIAHSLTQFQHEAITTLYMQFPETVRLDNYMCGLSDGIAQWFIDRRSCGQPGMIAAVISANGQHVSMDKASLTQIIIAETLSLFPDWPQPLQTYLIREKRATFSCTANITPLRPKPGSIGQHIWLAGDYLDTGYPATLEGAIVSGVQCAHQLIESEQ